MEQVKKPAASKTQPEVPSVKWEEMTRNQKIVFALKIALCVVSFGFIYPGITSD